MDEQGEDANDWLLFEELEKLCAEQLDLLKELDETFEPTQEQKTDTITKLSKSYAEYFLQGRLTEDGLKRLLALLMEY